MADLGRGCWRGRWTPSYPMKFIFGNFRGWVWEAKIFKEKYRAYLEFPEGWGDSNQGRSMDIFWNNTFLNYEKDLPCSCTAFFPELPGIVDVTTNFGDVPCDPKPVDHDKNRGLGTRQVKDIKMTPLGSTLKGSTLVWGLDLPLKWQSQSGRLY